jgi:hypothetical protein
MPTVKLVDENTSNPKVRAIFDDIDMYGEEAINTLLKQMEDVRLV